MLPYRADALVVLGRGIDPDGSLPRLAKQRVERAAELFAWETAPRIIFSGRCSLMTDDIPSVTDAVGVTAGSDAKLIEALETVQQRGGRIRAWVVGEAELDVEAPIQRVGTAWPL